jgi:predicted RND superfamily exporter protein
VKNTTFSKIEHAFALLIKNRVLVVLAVAISTAIMAYLASHVEVKTVFSDLLPKNHPYVEVNQKFKSTFGGSNMVSIMVEVKDGDIFKREVLEKVQKLTVGLQQVDAVDTFQIVSIASKKTKEVRASTEGVESRPIMWPQLPKDDAEMAILKEAVLNNTLIYGPYVSIDLKATLITADFLDQEINYSKAFEQIMGLVKDAEGDGVQVRVVGEPVLYGWVNFYLDETIQIFFAAIASLVLILLLITRTWHGTIVPLVAAAISACWALGAAKLMGFHLDPLVIVVAFLITAQAISNSVQLISRFDDEIARGTPTAQAAASSSAQHLFKPSLLAIVADAGCVLVVALTPIPMLEKISYIGTVWIFSILISALIMTPVLLSWFQPRKNADGTYSHKFVHPINIRPVLMGILALCTKVVTTKARYVVLGAAFVVFLVSFWYSFNLKVGDANPGSPILWPDSQYNEDATDINRQFQGSDRMFVVVAGKEKGSLRQPEVLQSMANFQRYMEAQPEVGGSISLADILPQVRRVLREGNPMYGELGNDADENGELTYMFVSGSDPGDMARYADSDALNGAVTLFFRDHQGETIRTAVARVQDYVKQNPIENAEYLLAGGLVGVLAAVNEVILAGQIEAIALALLVLVVCCTVTFHSMVAGVFFMIPVMLSNTITFSYMAYNEIGMNINTLPVVALGIGLGVDYTFYIVDGIREELHLHDNVEKAILNCLNSQGRGVLLTALTLITSVGLWSFSSLRLQADMGLLIALWLFISAFSALFIMPAIVYVFRPAFVVGSKSHPIERAAEHAVVV